MIEDAEAETPNELVKLMESVANKSQTTQKNYRRSYFRLRELINKDIHSASQEIINNTINEGIENINSRAALLNIAILVRRLHNLDTSELIQQRNKNKESVNEQTKMNNQFIQLPTIEALDDYLEQLYVKQKWGDYIINYLLRHHYVRNQDLLFDIVAKKGDTEDPEKNYIWVNRRKLECTYIRNKYKTANTYGSKSVVITNERFLHALKKVVKPIIPNESQVGYYVQKASLNGIGEGATMKIIVNHYKHDIHKLKEISESRGTNIGVLLTSYNIEYT